MRGRLNSSITRVRPFFSALLARDSTGEVWLQELLAAAPRADVLPETIRCDPGRLLPQLAEPREYRDQILGPIELPRMFEHSAPPSRAFLRWLIENPDRLRWPERRPGVRIRYGDETQRLREVLVEGRPEERATAQAQAFAELEGCGPEGSRRKWWAFEGHTEVDCWIETDRLLLFIEGKRTEPLSASTHWYPARNQLVRNLEVVGELARGRAAAVMLVSEQPVAELTGAVLAARTPHIRPPARCGSSTDTSARRHGQSSANDSTSTSLLFRRRLAMCSQPRRATSDDDDRHRPFRAAKGDGVLRARP